MTVIIGIDNQNDRITRKTDFHSNSSMKVSGTYKEGVTRKEVEDLVQGTFGGRFETFDNGRYVYIAYTD